MDERRCSKCGQTLKKLMLIALLQDAGARCSPGALQCPTDGGDHEWGDETKAAEAGGGE